MQSTLQYSEHVYAGGRGLCSPHCSTVNMCMLGEEGYAVLKATQSDIAATSKHMHILTGMDPIIPTKQAQTRVRKMFACDKY